MVTAAPTNFMQVEKKITEFIERLKQCAGASLECVALFGSAVADDFHPDFSDINLMCVVQDLSAKTLADIAPAVKWWTKNKFPAPLVFSRAELERSADVFAIEMLDIRERHRILHGEDIFAGLRVPMDLHRIQVEHDLRTKSLTLRQLFVQATGDDAKVRKLMLDSVSSFATLFRHTLIAMGEPSSPRKADNIKRLAERVKFDPGIFLQLLQVRARQASESSIDANAGFARYLESIDKVVAAVDAL